MQVPKNCGPKHTIGLADLGGTPTRNQLDVGMLGRDWKRARSIAKDVRACACLATASGGPFRNCMAVACSRRLGNQAQVDARGPIHIDNRPINKRCGHAKGRNPRRRKRRWSGIDGLAWQTLHVDSQPLNAMNRSLRRACDAEIL